MAGKVSSVDEVRREWQERNSDLLAPEIADESPTRRGPYCQGLDGVCADNALTPDGKAYTRCTNCQNKNAERWSQFAQDRQNAGEDLDDWWMNHLLGDL